MARLRSASRLNKADSLKNAPEQIGDLGECHWCVDVRQRQFSICQIVGKRHEGPTIRRKIRRTGNDAGSCDFAYAVDDDLRLDDPVAGVIDDAPGAPRAGVGAVIGIRRLRVSMAPGLVCNRA